MSSPVTNILQTIGHKFPIFFFSSTANLTDFKSELRISRCEIVYSAGHSECSRGFFYRGETDSGSLVDGAGHVNWHAGPATWRQTVRARSVDNRRRLRHSRWQNEAGTMNRSSLSVMLDTFILFHFAYIERWDYAFIALLACLTYILLFYVPTSKVISFIRF